MSRLFEALQKAVGASQGRDIQAVFLPGDIPTSSNVTADPSSEASGADGQSGEPGAKSGTAGETRSVYRQVRLKMRTGVPALPFDGSEPRAAEQYRIIRTRIVHDVRKPRICLVSSPTPGDGKTITTVNIAGSLALKSGVTSILVECDLRRPGMAGIFGIPAEPGLAGVLEARASLEEAILQVEEIPGFYIMPAGQVHANPTELLDSPRWKDVCATLKRQFQYCVLDSPPIGSVADYELLEQSAEGIVVVVRPDHTNRALAGKAIETVPKDKLLGVVINCSKEWFLRRPPGGYYHYAEYH